jgi:glycosyltransferase involved in cell wall biosynthesis
MMQSQSRHSHFKQAGITLRLLEETRPIVDRDVPDADLVIATWWETAEWVMQLDARKGTKAHLMQDYEAWAGPADRVDSICACTIPKIVTAQWLAEMLERRFNQTNVRVVPYGVDKSIFSAPPRTKQPEPTVGLSYSNLHRKGTDIVLEAVRIARKSVPRLGVIAVGTVHPTPNLPIPSAAQYTLCANDRELRDLYSRCDAWLFGTREEGFGLPILEAMACRTPVIGTPAGAAPLLLRDGAGMLVRPEDPIDMARAIVELCNMSHFEWQSLSQKAHARTANYSWTNAAREFEAALKNLLHRKT